MAATSSSPARLHPSEPSSPIVTRTPLPHALVKLAPPAPLDSSPCVLPAPGAAKTPASAYTRPSSPTAHKEATFSPTSSPIASSPDAYALRPAKRARLTPAGPGRSPVTPLPVGPGKAAAQAGSGSSAPRRAGSSAMAKKMSDAGCKMGSFKVHVAPAAATRTPASHKRKAAAKATPGGAGETPSGGMKIAGFRHLSSATPIASRTVAKQPKLEEVKMLSPSKRAREPAPAAEPSAPKPASVGMAKVPSVLQPVPGRSHLEEGEGSPVAFGKVPWTWADDEAILRLNEAMRGDFEWIARALRPVRFPSEVAQRFKQ